MLTTMTGKLVNCEVDFSGMYEIKYCSLKPFNLRYPNIPFEIKSTFLLSIVICILHVIDRHTESRSRADFLWKAKLQVSPYGDGDIS